MARNTGTTDPQVAGSETVAPAPKPDLTPYAAAKVVTVKVRQRTSDDSFELAPQTMYGLASRNIIKTKEGARKADGSHKILFDGEAFAEWLAAYLSGVGTESGRIRQNYEKLADVYALTSELGAEDEPEGGATGEDETVGNEAE